MIPFTYKISLEKFHQEVGSLIKLRRGKMSQAKLAQAIGLTRTSVNNIEHGRQRILLDTLLMISDILNVKMVNLLPKHFKVLKTVKDQIPKGTSESLVRFIEEVQGS